MNIIFKVALSASIALAYTMAAATVVMVPVLGAIAVLS